MKASTGHMMRTQTKVWAIRNGDIVELRRAKSLTKVKAKLTKTATVHVDAYGYPIYAPREQKIVLESVSFTGGKVLGYIKLLNFRRRFEFTPPNNEAVKLTALQTVKALRGRKFDDEEGE